ncbi:cytochrome P450 2H1-like isoform X2 [Notechis scutatus]|uniref:Cytochrome P450 2H1-like isoform X2 n=1 Tax=Notechis scutatus TaxID=8663 RepID=A0A6J1VZ18_9SAUR|nr:cytochrome P450 2H1-like isoform X2 [Notechis scutatus]XP_026548278.1 cytochrome P450 2H1-like isoform X2 [Notechis scutatus]
MIGSPGGRLLSTLSHLNSFLDFSRGTQRRMELTWTGILLLLCVLFILFSSFQMYKKKGQLPPGPTPWPLLGNLLHQDVLPLNASYKKLIGQYGPIFTIWIGSKPLVVLCGYKMIKEALIDRAEEFGGRNTLPTIERIFHNQRQPFEPKRKCTSAVSNVISTVVFGNRFDYRDQTFIENQKTMESLLNLCNNFTGMVCYSSYFAPPILKPNFY